MSLKFKIAFLVSGLILAAVGCWTAILVLSEAAVLERTIKDKQRDAVLSFASVCKEALITQHDILLSNYLRTLKNIPGVIEAMFVDSSGKLMGHTDPSKWYTVLADPRTQESLSTTDVGWKSYNDSGRQVLEIDAPVRHGTRRLGTARILLSEGVIQLSLQQDLAAARSRILQLSLPILLLGFIGAFFITAIVMRPVQALVQGARLVASGKLGHRISISTGDELGQLAQEFNTMAGKLRELDEMKQDFVSSVTHDLKSPLAAMKISAELLLSETEKVESGQANIKKMAEMLFSFQINIERLTTLIISLLEVAKIESGLVLEESDVNLEDIAQKVIDSFSLLARQRQIALRLVVDQAVPNIRADAAKLERVVANLIGNAVKFTSSGEITLQIRPKDDFQELRVADTGPGISPEGMAKLFTKFYRLPDSKRTEGTGLGLAIVKGLVEAHGGQVRVESRVGQGTTFIVQLPQTRKSSQKA